MRRDISAEPTHRVDPPRFVDPAVGPWAAPQESPDRLRSTEDGPIQAKCARRVVRAARLEPTPVRKESADGHLIDPDRGQDRPGNPAHAARTPGLLHVASIPVLRSTRSQSPMSASKGASAAPVRALKTTIAPGTRRDSNPIIAARTRLRIRLRTDAFPIRREIAYPILVGPSPGSITARHEIGPETARFPAASMSRWSRNAERLRVVIDRRCARPD